MAKASNHHQPAKVRHLSLFRTPNESSLAGKRIRELDREFAHQTKQLTELSKRLKHKVEQRLHHPSEPSDN